MKVLLTSLNPFAARFSLSLMKRTLRELAAGRVPVILSYSSRISSQGLPPFFHLNIILSARSADLRSRGTGLPFGFFLRLLSVTPGGITWYKMPSIGVAGESCLRLLPAGVLLMEEELDRPCLLCKYQLSAQWIREDHLFRLPSSYNSHEGFFLLCVFIDFPILFIIHFLIREMAPILTLFAAELPLVLLHGRRGESTCGCRGKFIVIVLGEIT